MFVDLGFLHCDVKSSKPGGTVRYFARATCVNGNNDLDPDPYLTPKSSSDEIFVGGTTFVVFKVTVV